MKQGFRMAGFTRYGDWVEFGIEDGPLQISEARLALTARKHSMLLVIPTIGLGLHGIYEGDRIYACGVTGTAVYAKGLRMQMETGELKPLPGAEHIKVVERTEENYRGIDCKQRTRILFSCCGRVYSLGRMLGLNSGLIHVMDLSFGHKADGISLWTGYYWNGKRVFYGDIVDGCKVGINGFLPALFLPDGIYRLLDEYGFESSNMQLSCDLNK